MKRGLYASLKHKCRAKLTLAPYTRATLTEAFKGIFDNQPKEPPKVRLLMGLDGFNLMKSSWQTILSPTPA